MTVEQLIEKLRQQDPLAKVRLTVCNPKTSASSAAEVEVKDCLGEVIVTSWVASDDEDAWMAE